MGGLHTMTQAPGKRLVVGCMTGTSIDGLDVALVEIEGVGLGMRAAMVRGRSAELGAELQARLRMLCAQKLVASGVVSQVALEFGLLHARVIRDLLREAGDAKIAMVSAHGQTVFHEPPVSWQLLNAAPIAQALAVPVVFDLRQADLAMDGQGAPITPLADWVLLRSERESRVVVNLGGFCNMTVLGKGEENNRDAWVSAVRGCDVCACNQVIDAAARRGLDRAFDEDGASALRGVAHAEATAELSAGLRGQSAGGRSLGTGDEAQAWVERWGGKISGQDLARSACEAVGGVIGASVRELEVERALMAGGGTRNRALMGAIERAAGSVAVASTDAVGIASAYREAVCMAVLGALSADGVSITLPAVTGRRVGACVAGSWVGSCRGVHCGDER